MIRPTRLINPGDETSAETIKRHYDACMDSVNLIKKEKPEFMSDEEWADCVERNKKHIEIMLNKDFWTNEDLQPFRDAIE